jgi:hypothetical protein
MDTSLRFTSFSPGRRGGPAASRCIYVGARRCDFHQPIRLQYADARYNRIYPRFASGAQLLVGALPGPVDDLADLALSDHDLGRWP